MPQPPSRKPPVRAGGIHLVGILTLVLMVAASSFIAYRANRVAPASASVDSAWQKYGDSESDTTKLTKELRGAGFRCTDHSRDDGRFVRVCADHAADNPRMVEWAGSIESGDIYRVYVSMSPTGDGNRPLAEAAISSVVPDSAQRPEAISAFQQPDSSQVIQGEWGKAGYLEDGSFMATNDLSTGGVVEARMTSPAGSLLTSAERAGYTCEDEDSGLTCERSGADGEWTLKVPRVDGTDTGISLQVATGDVTEVDPAKALRELLPDDDDNATARSWLAGASSKNGSGAIWRGQIVEYRVNEPAGTVTASVRSTCHPVTPDTDEVVC